MEGKRTIRTIRLENFLSYGSEGQLVDLQPLNVLIGPNASGKSNFIEAFRFLSAVPTTDLTKPLREGGGASEYLWKGVPGIPTAKIEITVDNPEKNCPLNYRISFTADNWQRLRLLEEAIEYEDTCNAADDSFFGPPSFVYRFPHQNRKGFLHFKNPMAAPPDIGPPYISQEVSIDANRSILGWVRNPDQYPELAYLENLFSNIQFAGEWQLSRYGPVRTPQRTDLPTDILWEDASNLGLILTNYSTKTREKIIGHLKQVYDGIEEIRTRIEGNTVQIFIQEQHLDHPTPAIRLSDGTLRYLCLLTLLDQPKMPPLLCLEEPEVGLHPDVISTVAELLVEASAHTQLIVTTHSDKLVSALAEVPEAIIVCERDQSGSHLRRLDPERLKKWLEKYSLGELWMMGEIGGTRW